MAFDYEGAKKAGYTDSEIADHLAKQSGFDVAGARKSGYSDADIVQHLTKSSAPVKSEPTTLDQFKRQMGLTGRYLMEGAESAVTFPVRAVAEAVSGGLNLAGKKDAADYVHRTLGMGGNAGRVVADAASLPTPEGKLENAVAGGSRMLAGLGTGNILNKVVSTSPQVVKDTIQGLVPGASSGGEAATAAAIGAGLEAAPEATLGTLGTIAAIKGGKAVAGAVDDTVGKIRTNRAATKFIEKAGNSEDARIAAEITKDYRTVATNPNLKNVDEETGVIGAALRNSQAKTYINNVESALERVDPGLLKKYDVATILDSSDVVSPQILERIRSEKNGGILADAIEKAQVAKAMTAPTPASGSIPAILTRMGITALPAAAGTALGGGWGAALGGMATPAASNYAKRLTGKQTIPEVITKMASDKQQRVADEVLKRLGPSQASLGADELANAARQAEKAQATAAAQKLAETDELTGILNKVTQDRNIVNRSGPLQALEQGFGISSKDMDTVLSDLVKQHPEMQKIVDRLYTNNGSVPNLTQLSDIIRDATGKSFNAGVLNQTGPGVLSGVSGNDVSRMIYGMADDQVAKLLGRTTDTLGDSIQNAKGYLTTQASRALKSLNEGKVVTEADKALLKELGLI